jgi:hypothetical protein
MRTEDCCVLCDEGRDSGILIGDDWKEIFHLFPGQNRYFPVKTVENTIDSRHAVIWPKLRPKPSRKQTSRCEEYKYTSLAVKMRATWRKVLGKLANFQLS